MTSKELIAALQSLDPGGKMPVLVWDEASDENLPVIDVEMWPELGEDFITLRLDIGDLDEGGEHG
jgi:hypothetical protein